jgi:hypothetical protein
MLSLSRNLTTERQRKTMTMLLQNFLEVLDIVLTSYGFIDLTNKCAMLFTNGHLLTMSKLTKLASIIVNNSLV